MIAVNCMGEMYSTIASGEVKKSSTMIDLNQSLALTSGPNLEDELNIDKNTLETIKELY